MMLRRGDDPRRQDVYWNGADLVIEVISEDDPDRDLDARRLEYAQAGIPEYWIVDPRDRSITVLQLAAEQYEVFDRFDDRSVVTSPTLGEVHITVSAVFGAQ
jgi:Uma2 family endonuclease